MKRFSRLVDHIHQYTRQRVRKNDVNSSPEVSEQGINFAWQPLLFLYNADHIRNVVRHPLVKAGGPLLTTDHKLNPWSSLQTTIKVTLFDDGHLWILLHISVWVTCFHLHPLEQQCNSSKEYISLARHSLETMVFGDGVCVQYIGLLQGNQLVLSLTIC